MGPFQNRCSERAVLPYCFQRKPAWKQGDLKREKSKRSEILSGAPGTIRTSDPQIRRLEHVGQLSAHVGQLLVRDQALTRHHRQRRSIKDDDRTVFKSVLLEQPNACGEPNRKPHP